MFIHLKRLFYLFLYAHVLHPHISCIFPLFLMFLILILIQMQVLYT